MGVVIGRTGGGVHWLQPWRAHPSHLWCFMALIHSSCTHAHFHLFASPSQPGPLLPLQRALLSRTGALWDGSSGRHSNPLCNGPLGFHLRGRSHGEIPLGCRCRRETGTGREGCVAFKALVWKMLESRITIPAAVIVVLGWRLMISTNLFSPFFFIVYVWFLLTLFLLLWCFTEKQLVSELVQPKLLKSLLKKIQCGPVWFHLRLKPGVHRPLLDNLWYYHLMEMISFTDLFCWSLSLLLPSSSFQRDYLSIGSVTSSVFLFLTSVPLTCFYFFHFCFFSPYPLACLNSP